MTHIKIKPLLFRNQIVNAMLLSQCKQHARFFSFYDVADAPQITKHFQLPLDFSNHHHNTIYRRNKDCLVVCAKEKTPKNISFAKSSSYYLVM